MKLEKLLRSSTACVLAAALLSPSAMAASARPNAVFLAGPGTAVVSRSDTVAATDSANVIAAALAEVGYVETAKEYTKFGAWYGLPNAYWCDMFVSWCAMTGGVPESQFPRNCSCTSHVAAFTKMGRYQVSASRGGTYIPQQGDVIFFYNYQAYPTGKVCSHTGLVLYVEDGYVYTIEGNALTNRLDYSFLEVAAEIDGDLDPLDHVVVNRYPLDAPRIHGYGIPAYDSRTPLELNGFVDLGKHAGSAAIFQYVSDLGVMPATSKNTFSPDHGMTRGDFLALVTDFFGIAAIDEMTLPFDDVSPDSPSYAAVMAARSAGLVNGTDDNLFQPDIYISSSDAQTIFDRALGCLGLEAMPFSFSEGDYSYLLTPYTIRADIAKAFYMLCQQMPLSEAFDGQVFLGEEECSARNLDGVCYVPVDVLRELFPELELIEEEQEEVPEEAVSELELENEPEEEPEDELEEASPEAEPEEEPEETVSEPELEEDIPDELIPIDEDEKESDEEPRQSASVWNMERVIPSVTALRYGEEMAEINGFRCQGTTYVDLYAAARFLSVELEYSEEAVDEDFPDEIVTVLRLVLEEEEG